MTDRQKHIILKKLERIEEFVNSNANATWSFNNDYEKIREEIQFLRVALSNKTEPSSLAKKGVLESMQSINFRLITNFSDRERKCTI